jgi:hypothetical protein
MQRMPSPRESTGKMGNPSEGGADDVFPPSSCRGGRGVAEGTSFGRFRSSCVYRRGMDRKLLQAFRVDTCADSLFFKQLGTLPVVKC